MASRHNVDIKEKELKTFLEREWLKEAGGWLYFIPNNIAIDFANVAPVLAVGSDEFEGENKRSNSGIDRVMRYLGSINAHRVQPPTRRWSWRYNFQFVPSGYIAYQNINYPEVALLSDIEYRRFIFGAGYGPQFGFNSRNGFLYLNLHGGFNWSEIRWESLTDTGVSNRFAVNVLTELGYSYFISDRLNIRIFSRFVSESVELWEKAFFDSTGQELEFDSVGYRYTGVSLGYYFPAAEHPFKSWFKR